MSLVQMILFAGINSSFISAGICHKPYTYLKESTNAVDAHFL